jgi:hypothetical protein
MLKTVLICIVQDEAVRGRDDGATGLCALFDVITQLGDRAEP